MFQAVYSHDSSFFPETPLVEVVEPSGCSASVGSQATASDLRSCLIKELRREP
jgi:hypothetical protein